MAKHEIRSCPRCAADFECKVGDVANCQCSQVRLHPDTHAFLAKTYYDCLCKKCLEKIDRLVHTARGSAFPIQPELLIEGLHYYRDNGQWVFTEYYHLLRGRCCRNGCRHCAYGFKK